MADPEELRARLTLPRYPRSAAYDPSWTIANAMGPNPLWLTEWLCEALPMEPGTRVLDLGCGRAITSIFLAREFACSVVAADLWIDPTQNWTRITAAGAGDRVLPVRAEAHDLPFADGYFDAIVSVDAYHYFGTDDRYIGYISRFLRPGGRLGIVVPSVREELTGVPAHLAPYWEWDFLTFHSPQWWRGRWQLSGRVEVEAADWLDDGWRDWRLWSQVCAQAAAEPRATEAAAREEAALTTDQGRTLGFARVIARRP